MKPNSYLLLSFTLASLLAPQVLRAEHWPPFEQFASNCVLIIKARQVGPFSTNENSVLTFEVTETWKGRFDPKTFTKTSPEGYIRAGQGEHGVRVTAGQEVVFFFTRHNQPEGKLARHNTAFPITDGKLVYGSTSESGERQVFTTTEFKRAIAALSVSAQKDLSDVTSPRYFNGYVFLVSCSSQTAAAFVQFLEKRGIDAKISETPGFAEGVSSILVHGKHTKDAGTIVSDTTFQQRFRLMPTP